MKGGLYALQSNNCCLDEEAEGQGLLLNGKKMRWRDFSVPPWAGAYSKIKLFLLFSLRFIKMWTWCWEILKAKGEESGRG